MDGWMDGWMDGNLNLWKRFQNVIIQEAVTLIYILKQDSMK